jgi:hypothetical protein
MRSIQRDLRFDILLKPDPVQPARQPLLGMKNEC